MLCEVCFRMLRWQDGRVWVGTHDINFEHHKNRESLRRSADMHCGICQVLDKELRLKQSNTATELVLPRTDHGQLSSTGSHQQIRNRFKTHVDIRSYSPKDPLFAVSAALSVLDYPEVRDIYRLDFKIRCDQIESKRTFILHTIDPNDPIHLSEDTDSEEVYALVLTWIKKCSRGCKAHCGSVSDQIPGWYPTRLICLEGLKKRKLLENEGSYGRNPDASLKVRLVETKEWGNRRPLKDNRYVTLSHCWGKNTASSCKLTSRNIEAMKAGIQVSELPKTFQDAVVFAARLPRVGYIWIDSLCIKQGAEDELDWLEQSASMYKVYSETFLNISATDAPDSEGGLFRKRHPELINECTLSIQDLPGAHPSKVGPSGGVVQTAKPSGPSAGRRLIQALATYWIVRQLFRLLHLLHHELGALFDLAQASASNPVLNQQEVKARSLQNTGVADAVKPIAASEPARRHDTNLRRHVDSPQIQHHNLKRCTISDASLWSDRVDKAPVNQRGWVLQERLMSPRVLHFCQDQVAWECSGFEAAEGQPQSMPNLQFKSGGVIEESRFKGLDEKEDGKRLRSIRLHGHRDPDIHIGRQVYALEIWSHIVEAYSKTSITNDDDRLIALAGMAELMADKIGSKRKPAKYAAGLWEDYLESQLLWWVEPVFNEVDRTFETPSHLPVRYRAPSWSWAAVNADKGLGITYADVTDRDLYIKIESVSVEPRDKKNIYGIVESGATYLDMWGKLHPAILYKKPKGRFGWRLIRQGVAMEEHTNVYLDCPRSESRQSIFGYEHGDSQVYVIPAAKGPRITSEDSKYLTCLLVQHQPSHRHGSVFKRVGITRLSPWLDGNTRAEIVKAMPSDISLPHRGYNAETGMHKIRLV